MYELLIVCEGCWWSRVEGIEGVRKLRQDSPEVEAARLLPKYACGEAQAMLNGDPDVIPIRARLLVIKAPRWTADRLDFEEATF